MALDGSALDGSALNGSALGSTCSTETVRVVVADGAVLTRDALACLLLATGFDVVAEVGDDGALLAAVAATRPDVVVVDVWIPSRSRLDGFEVVRTLRRVHPRLGVLLIAHHPEGHHLARLLSTTSAGLGYLIKERVAGREAFAAAVRLVARGGRVIDPDLVSVVRGAPRPDPVAALSGRERDVLALMAEGCSNQGIADRLHLTEKTVESHVRSILLRLGIAAEPQQHRRVLAVLRWLQSGHAQTGSGADGHPRPELLAGPAAAAAGDHAAAARANPVLALRTRPAAGPQYPQVEGHGRT